MSTHPSQPDSDTDGRWPASATDYVLEAPDQYVNDEHAWKNRYKDDPRPNAGVTCNGRYLPDDWRTRPCRQQYHCLPCGLRKTVCVTHHDAKRTINFACPACRECTTHAPAGASARLVGHREQQRETEGTDG